MQEHIFNIIFPMQLLVKCIQLSLTDDANLHSHHVSAIDFTTSHIFSLYLVRSLLFLDFGYYNGYIMVSNGLEFHSLMIDFCAYWLNILLFRNARLTFKSYVCIFVRVFCLTYRL